MKKLIITISVLVVAVLSFFLSDLFRRNDETGTITIIVVDEIGDVVHNNTYSFTEEDTLLGIMEENYAVFCANNQYQADSCDTEVFMGRVILAIDDVETDWLNTYLAIYINDEYSNYGIDDILLEDGNVYRFEFTEVGDEVE